VTDTMAIAPTPVGMTLRSLLTADAQTILRSRLTLAFNLIMPIVILIVTDRGKLGDPEFLIAMALTYGLLSSALMGYSITMARDREAGVFQRLRVAPVPTWAIMVSRLAVQLAAAIATVVIVIIVGSILHSVVYDAGTYALMFVIAVYGAVMFLSIGQALVGLIRSATAVNAIGRVLYILLILIGILGATGILGDTVENIAEWSPVGALITLFTAVQSLAGWSWTDTGAILACAGYIIVFAGIGIRWFQWETS
jgi:ABC-2 type transport system permease protein